MKLFERGAAILLLIAIVTLSFSGCIAPAADTSTQAPGAQAASFPLTTNYIQDGAITSAKIATGTVTDTLLAASAIPFNITVNNTASIITGTGLAAQNINGSVTINRASALTVTVSLNYKTSNGNNSYLQVRLNRSTNAAGSNGSTMLPGQIFLGQSPDYNATSFTFVNTSISAGTYAVEVYGNSSSTGVVNYANVTLVSMALPK